MWQDRPWTGYGLKSFRVVCRKILDRDYERTFNPEVEAIYKVFPEKGTTLIYVMRNCSNHPHHYYLELLSETGIVGTFLIIILFFNLRFTTVILCKLGNNQLCLLK